MWSEFHTFEVFIGSAIRHCDVVPNIASRVVNLSSALNNMAPTSSAPLFKPFRALGYITEDVPFVTQRRGKETYVTVSVGRAWQVGGSDRIHHQHPCRRLSPPSRFPADIPRLSPSCVSVGPCVCRAQMPAGPQSVRLYPCSRASDCAPFLILLRPTTACIPFLTLTSHCVPRLIRPTIALSSCWCWWGLR